MRNSKRCKIILSAMRPLRYPVNMNLKAIVHPAEEGGYWAEVPALPGCFSQGETKEELEANLREAIEAWLEAGEGGFESGSGQQVLELAV